MTSWTTTGPRGQAASAHSVLGQIRKMLRAEPVLEREVIRDRLRAKKMIGRYEEGGRRVYFLIHYLRRRGEITTTPTHITAADVLPPWPGKKRAPRPSNGPRARRMRLAAKRARAVARRSLALKTGVG